jgi:UDP-2,3-diacylglucosamine hydrolase
LTVLFLRLFAFFVAISSSSTIASSIGLIAGWGRYPIVVAQTLKAAGYRVHCIGLTNHADAALADICDDYYPCGIAKIGYHLRFFRRCGVSQATLVGKIFKHRILLGRWGWMSLVPDWPTFKMFFPLFVSGKSDRRDDTILSTIVHEFGRGGIEMLPATNFAPELLVKPGLLTRRRPSGQEQADIEFGWKMAKELGRLDIGQSVAVKGRIVVAAEAIEGTDECIRRAGQLCQQGGFTLVKVAKPQQDMRFDVPTIGIGTIESLLAAHGKVLAIEAAKTIVIDQDEVVRLANQHGMSIIALEDGGLVG